MVDRTNSKWPQTVIRGNESGDKNRNAARFSRNDMMTTEFCPVCWNCVFRRFHHVISRQSTYRTFQFNCRIRERHADLMSFWPFWFCPFYFKLGLVFYLVFRLNSFDWSENFPFILGDIFTSAFAGSWKWTFMEFLFFFFLGFVLLVLGKCLGTLPRYRLLICTPPLVL